MKTLYQLCLRIVGSIDLSNLSYQLSDKILKDILYTNNYSFKVVQYNYYQGYEELKIYVNFALKTRFEYLFWPHVDYWKTLHNLKQFVDAYPQAIDLYKQIKVHTCYHMYLHSIQYLHNPYLEDGVYRKNHEFASNSDDSTLLDTLLNLEVWNPSCYRLQELLFTRPTRNDWLTNNASKVYVHYRVSQNLHGIVRINVFNGKLVLCYLDLHLRQQHLPLAYIEQDWFEIPYSNVLLEKYMLDVPIMNEIVEFRSRNINSSFLMCRPTIREYFLKASKYVKRKIPNGFFQDRNLTLFGSTTNEYYIDI